MVDGYIRAIETKDKCFKECPYKNTYGYCKLTQCAIKEYITTYSKTYIPDPEIPKKDTY